MKTFLKGIKCNTFSKKNEFFFPSLLTFLMEVMDGWTKKETNRKGHTTYYIEMMTFWNLKFLSEEILYQIKQSGACQICWHWVEGFFFSFKI